MKSILIIDLIDVKADGIEDGANKEIDNGRPSISLLALSSLYKLTVHLAEFCKNMVKPVH